jgi:hypothetical protein
VTVLVDTHVGRAAWRLGGLAFTLARLELVLDGPAAVSLTAAATTPVAALPAGSMRFHARVPDLTGATATVHLAAGDDTLNATGESTAEGLWAQLVDGRGFLSDPDAWYLISADDETGPMATGWAVRRSLTGDDEPPLPSLLARATAVLALEGFEPVWMPANPTTVVAGVDPQPGWTLGVAVDPEAGVTVAQVVLPAPRRLLAGEGPIASGLSLVDACVDGGELICSAAVHAIGAAVPGDTLAGMVDAVVDVAHRLTDGR